MMQQSNGDPGRCNAGEYRTVIGSDLRVFADAEKASASQKADHGDKQGANLIEPFFFGENCAERQADKQWNKKVVEPTNVFAGNVGDGMPQF